MDSTDARAPASIVVLATTMIVSGAEYLMWELLGEHNELAPLVLTTLVIAAVAVPAAGLIARVWSPFAGFAIGIAIAWAPFASVGVVHALSFAAVFVAVSGLMWRARLVTVVGITAAVCLAVGQHYYWSQHSEGDSENSALPDVVLLVMDTTRRDHLSVYGYQRPTTPNLERFAERAQVYDDAWSVAPWTSPSHASMFTGLLPAEHGVDGALAIPFPAGIETLPSVLSKAGYRTGGFPGNPNLFAAGWERGFDVYLPAEYQKNHTFIRVLNRLLRRSRDPADHAMTDRLLTRARAWWMQNSEDPRFLFLNVIDPHSPYLPTHEHFEAFLPDTDREEALAVQGRMRPDGSASPPWTERELDILSRLYDAELADMDRRIGQFIDWLDARGELDDTLFVVTSDHGERLGERGLVGHSLVMDPYLLRVPLLVGFPAKLAPARISERVQLDGLAGYILDSAGVPSEAMDGFIERRVSIAQYRPPKSIVDDMVEVDTSFDADKFHSDWCFVASDRFALEWSSVDEPVLTDLDADPDFTNNVAADFPAEMRSLEVRARTLPRFADAETHDIDPGLADKLKALGYMK